MNLFVYYAESITGPYVPHAANPVKTDIRSSRPAGNFIETNGRIYRPAQDCSETYGGKIQINEIVKLSETEFEEKTVKTILSPDKKFNKGFHTISSCGELTVFDTKSYIFSLSNFKRKLKRKIVKSGK